MHCVDESILTRIPRTLKLFSLEVTAILCVHLLLPLVLYFSIFMHNIFIICYICMLS